MSGVPAVPANRDLAAHAASERGGADQAWSEISAAAPPMAETMRRYLSQVATFLAPASVVAAELSLRVSPTG